VPPHSGGLTYPMGVMEEIGQFLRETRERLGLTLDEVERATRIRTHHIEAIERGDFEALPSPVQARGFLGNYADFLGLDRDDILLGYVEVLQSRRTRIVRAPVTHALGNRASVRIISRRPRWLSSDLCFAILILAAVITILIWGGRHVVSTLKGSSATRESASLIIPLSSPTATSTTQPPQTTSNTNLAVQPTETPLPTQPIVLGVADEVSLRILAEQRAWVQVKVDEKEAYRGRITSGEVLEFNGEGVIEVVTGNGAGLRIYYNGQDQGLLGDIDQVVIRLWTLDGVLTPTPTLTPTVTITPLHSATPTMTLPAQ
jgi:cytoskeletal protein RodZ